MASDLLSPVLAEEAPFQITFDAQCFRFFKHDKNCTLWLKPQSDTAARTGENLHQVLLCTVEVAII